MKTYDEAEYANNRLKETIVRLRDGTPIQINSIRGIREVLYLNLATQDGGVCSLEELNIDPVPLGYCNIQTHCSYLVRMPMRQDWKQGLRSNSLRDIAGRRVEVNFSYLVPTIIGKFPSFSDAIDRMKAKSKNPFNTSKAKPKSIAFNRDFCVKEENLIEYKGVFTVGVYTNSGGYDLKDRFGWVEDCLKLAM
jgi:hypothetical protein